MKIIAFIEDSEIIKKILKSAVGGSSENRFRELMARQLKPLSSMMNPHRPARMTIWSMPIIQLKPTSKKIQLQAHRWAMLELT